MPSGRAPGFAERVTASVREAARAASAPPPFIGVWRAAESTNDLARNAALDAEGRCDADGVFIAEEQTRGRGRHGRQWMSPRGGLYLSLLTEPLRHANGSNGSGVPARLGLLPIAAGVALAEAIRQVTDSPVVLRWPNDLDLDGRKVAGILTEAGFAPGRPGVAVVGFGVNLAPVAVGEEALAPAGALGAHVGRAELAAGLVRAFRATSRLLGADPARLRARWEALSPTARGWRCRARLAEGRDVHGVTAGLDPSGGIAVAMDGGGRTVVHAVDALRLEHRGPARQPAAVAASVAGP